jgi:lipopolysaccharide/colanic/teichoic acid biosynthesis glycosyltransferase
VTSYHLQKRALDLFVAITLLLLFLPFWIIVPLLILIDSGWPIFFAHTRIGQQGKVFKMYKFRSMINNADEFLHSGKDQKLLEEFKKGDWKLKNDPRITRLGKVLRSLTIDEFPQLINVLRGEMSMVGPRAYVQQEIDEQTKKYPSTKPLMETILSVKPGITGAWQTSGRNEIPFATRAKLDAEYARKQNIWEDVRILARTPKAMLSKW